MRRRRHKQSYGGLIALLVFFAIGKAACSSPDSKAPDPNPARPALTRVSYEPPPPPRREEAPLLARCEQEIPAEPPRAEPTGLPALHVAAKDGAVVAVQR